jgi:superfamily II DNA or RNA helicase
MTVRDAGTSGGRTQRTARTSLPPLRAWQESALSRFEASGARDFLAVATPGAGKTAFALVAAERAMRAQQLRRIVVVTPTQHLKRQWARAADGFGLALEPAWSSRSALPADLHGVVVTYQQVASSKATLRRLASQAFVILDEVHHAAESRAWGDAIRIAFELSPRRLSLSGTPFRSDENPIPFVRYENDEAIPDYEYGYADALTDGSVVRPVFFPRISGRMEWTSPDGSHRSAGFDEALDPVQAGQRLRTALSLKGEWLAVVLTRAHAELEALRRSDPLAAGMVIAIDQDHARGIAALLRDRAGVIPTLALSDDPGASTRILRFARGTAPWIVAVRMVSEGVDIPRLRVGVYATSTTTELFFRQAVGRLVRFMPGAERQSAFLFIPDDPRLRRCAGEIQAQRRHSLRRLEADRDGYSLDGSERPRQAERDGFPETENLYQPISAVPLGLDGRPLDPSLPLFAFAAGSTAATPPPEQPSAAPAPPSPRQRREALREQNAVRVREIVHRKRLSHLDVNLELNRRAGIRRVTEATIGQLEKRLAAAEAWLRRR